LAASQPAEWFGSAIARSEPPSSGAEPPPEAPRRWDGNVRIDLRLHRRRLGLAAALLPVRRAADERTACESCDGSQRGTTAQAGAVWGA